MWSLIMPNSRRNRKNKETAAESVKKLLRHFYAEKPERVKGRSACSPAHIPFECFFGDRDSTDEREQSSAIPQKIFVLYLIGKDGLPESMKTKFHNSRWLTGTLSRCFLSRKMDSGKHRLQSCVARGSLYKRGICRRFLGYTDKKMRGNRASRGKILIVLFFSQWIVRLTDKDGNHLQMCAEGIPRQIPVCFPI